MSERLKCAAIQRGGKIHDGLRSHYELRRSLGDPNPQVSNLNDEEGFITTTGRFVDRDEARQVGLASGQLHGMWERAERKLLSSDIEWDAR